MTRNRPLTTDQRESGLVQRMRRSVRALPVREPHVLLACSGGKDSVALAWILAELSRLQLLTFSIAHVHHGQHDHAELAVEAVHEIGRILGAPVTIQRLNQSDIDSHRGVGLEEAMRRERYLALARTAMERKADCIALAHHQTDQAETLLLHLMRGSGLDGLVGMQEWESRRVPWWGHTSDATAIGLWRPLIGELANEVAQVAAESGLPVVEDPTNIDPSYRRNAIRHQVLPVLENISEGTTAAIARSAEVISTDVDVLAYATRLAFAECVENNQIVRSRMVELPQSLQARVIRRWVLLNAPNLEFSADRVMAIANLLARNRGGSVVEIGSGHRVTLRDGKLTLD